MRIDIATLFPDMCGTVIGESILGRAVAKGALDLRVHNIRDYTLDKHRRVDDTPYGGGMGMVLQAEPLYRLYEAVAEESRPHVVYLSPQGRRFTQQDAFRLRDTGHLLLLCGHYEGVDERLLEEIVDEELSIGDFVLTGGELPALMVCDAVARLCDGVLSSDECFLDESFSHGLLEHPQYTKPAVWHDREVPEVLLSGHHKRIEEYRRDERIRRTFLKRPDLLADAELTEQERQRIAGWEREKLDA